ncbi:MAG: UDP-N-acetylglucosamine 2-epimerase (non-hydrolyzing) [Lentisphaeria bacterium]|nr:UDP-N-acetylglucosamine 2-epimerase (non-hydrolyzing) [Lentisphaeria bacterium]
MNPLRNKEFLFVYGTRPEAIKIAPLVRFFRTQGIPCRLCDTGQQKDLTAPVLSCFSLRSDFDLKAMRPNQSLAELQAGLLISLQNLLNSYDFDGVLVQGDTMSAYTGALSAFYHKIPVFHVEAGLRSYDLLEPWPEEGFRQMITRMASLHFAPTESAVLALEREHIDPASVILTGNTIIDALKMIDSDRLGRAEQELIRKGILNHDKTVLITVHRRENHGARMNSILSAISVIAEKHSDCRFVLPVHPNPAVHDRVTACLNGRSNICLCAPMDYVSLLSVIRRSALILTDSGGIQEEAPCFGVPLLVLREKTERMEGIDAGCAELIGTDEERIVQKADAILSGKADRRFRAVNPYGDGHASERIAKAILNFYGRQIG